MKKLINRSFILLTLTGFLFLLTACPYSAEFPLDNPNQNIMSDLMGKWVEDGSSENPTYFMISKKSGQEYKFDKYEYKSSEKKYESTPYIAHFTKIGNIDFLNLKDEKEGKYYFYKFEFGAGKKDLTLFEVTDNIDEKFGSSAEMKAFFDKYKDLSFFYNKDEKKYNKK